MSRFSESIAFLRYRVSVISTWPESDWKRAALESARAAIERELLFQQCVPRAARR